MAQTFFPEKSILVPASPPHKNAEYVISIGTEMWGSEPQKVIKVQMAYNGKISGRRSPSYPVNTNDYLEVNKVIQELNSL